MKSTPEAPMAARKKRRRKYCASGCCFQNYVCTQCRGGGYVVASQRQSVDKP